MTLRDLLTRSGLSPEDLLDVEVGQPSVKGVVVSARLEYDEFPQFEIKIYAPMRSEAGKR